MVREIGSKRVPSFHIMKVEAFQLCYESSISSYFCRHADVVSSSVGFVEVNGKSMRLQICIAVMYMKHK